MSQSKPSTPSKGESKTSTREFYDQRQSEVDDLADRDDALGALARAVQIVAQQGGDQ